MLGLAHDRNIMVPYDPRWPLAYEAERQRLAEALGPLVLAIEHYGSTAVPGLSAKPILDILLGVRQLDDWQQCHDPLIGLGYDYAAQAGVPGHHIFGRGRDLTERTHLVHVVEHGGVSWTSNLAFRDALRADEALRQRYLAVKIAAIAQAPDSRLEYNRLKGGAIAAMKSHLASPRH